MHSSTALNQICLPPSSSCTEMLLCIVFKVWHLYQQLVEWLLPWLGGTGFESQLGWPFMSCHLILVCVNYDLNGSLRINSRLHARLNNQISHPIPSCTLSQVSLHRPIKITELSSNFMVFSTQEHAIHIWLSMSFNYALSKIAIKRFLHVFSHK